MKRKLYKYVKFILFNVILNYEKVINESKALSMRTTV